GRTAGFARQAMRQSRVRLVVSGYEQGRQPTLVLDERLRQSRQGASALYAAQGRRLAEFARHQDKGRIEPMAQPEIRFDDGAAYEEGMGRWSRLAGNVFLDWLEPARGLRWIDVGCGSGAFTELLIERCAPSETHGVDPSNGQLAFARQRPGARG